MAEHARHAPDVLPDADAVRADDQLLDELGRGGPGADRGHDPVQLLLAAWRDEIDDRPAPAGPSLDEAVAALGAHRTPAHRRRGLLVPLAAAAVVGLALVGVGVGAHQATPGDPLWTVSQTLFADRSRSVQAAVDVEADLSQAALALSAGSPAQASAALAQARQELAAVAPAQGRAALQQRHDALAAQLAATAPTATSVAPGPTAPSSVPAAPVPTTRRSAPTTTTPVPVRTTTAAPATTTPAPTAPPVTSTTPPPVTTTVPVPTSVPTTEPPVSTVAPTTTDAVVVPAAAGPTT